MSTHPQRPLCFLNVAASLDGKIASSAREMPLFPSPEDRRVMDRIRARADAVLISGGTLRAADYPLTIRSRSLRRQRRAAGRPEQPLNILLSGSLRVPARGRFFSAPEIRRLVVTCRSASAQRARSLRTTSEVLLLGQDRVDLKRLMRELAGRGIEALLLEGGGETNFEFFRQGWVDEVYLTLCPLIIGGRKSPTPVDGAGLTMREFRRYRLLSVRRCRDEIFLHYRIGSPQGG